MKIQQDFKDFYRKYYDTAKKFADITIAEHVKKNGILSPFIDVELVKNLGVCYALEIVYNTYDIDHEKRAKIETYMSGVVRDKVLTELGKEGTSVRAGKRGSNAVEDLKGKDLCIDFKEYLQDEIKHTKKDELIAEMLRCMKSMDGIDQLILNCWMSYPRSEYTEAAIKELELEDNYNSRNLIQRRLNRAIAKLGKKMEKFRPAFLTINNEQRIHSPRNTTQPGTDYNFVRRRRRAARRSIADSIDYAKLEEQLNNHLL